MRILWVSLVEFPPLCKYLGKKVPVHCGWLYSSFKTLIDETKDFEIGVIVYSKIKNYEKHIINGIVYYLIPSRSLTTISRKQVSACKIAISDFEPDLIHLHGSEHSLAKAVCLANNGKYKILCSIQGLAGPYTRYADGGIDFKDKLFNITLIDILRGTYILNAKNQFRKRSECEEYVIKNITDVAGRTEWDHDHVLTINPRLKYHFLNETLRDAFYTLPIWDYSRCKKHTIFVSNSNSPLKGAHQVIKALPIILRSYPDTIVNFCGSSIMNKDFNTIIHFQGYHKYLRNLVKKFNLEKHVNFMGNLTEIEMKQAFLEANIYILPSAIENSPNSLCEAQILGVPSISSYCGGTPSLIQDKISGFLYRYEEYEMLAQLVIQLFDRSDFKELSTKEQEIAKKRHDKIKNAEDLIKIYHEIIELN